MLGNLIILKRDFALYMIILPNGFAFISAVVGYNVPLKPGNLNGTYVDNEHMDGAGYSVIRGIEQGS